MRLPIVLALTLLCSAGVLAQPRPVVEDKGNFGLHVVDDAIMQYKYLERENQLLLIGYKHLQLLDLTNFKVIDTRPMDLPYTDVGGSFDYSDWAVSPDGRRMVLVGLRQTRTKLKDGTKQAAWVLDLQTGKHIALLDHPDRIRTAMWSKDGKTLVTMDAAAVDLFTRALKVSFWDGETLQYRHTITVDNVTWIYLSNDGTRFFAASGKQKNLLGVKYTSDSDSVVRIWKTGSGEIEKTIAIGNAEFHPKTREIQISPDEKFLLMVNKHKSDRAQHRLLAWRIDGGVNPIYELQPRPTIADSRVVFSPDGTYFASDVGKDLQIYETETGRLTGQLTNTELPSWGWFDNATLAAVDFKSKNFFEMGKMLKVYDASDGHLLYKQRLAYSEVERPDLTFTSESTETVDDTTLLPHPNGKIFLTKSNESVKIFDSRTGELLQTVVEPLVRIDRMGKPKKTHGQTVRAADWSKDGNALYVLSANHTSVSLWKLIQD